MTAERDIENEIRRVVGSLPDVRIFKNNTGEYVKTDPRTQRAYRVKYGLMVGSADLIGLVLPWGRFLSIEVKKPGHKTSKQRQEEQRTWREIVERFGGVAGQAESVDEAMALVVRARELP